MVLEAERAGSPRRGVEHRRGARIPFGRHHHLVRAGQGWQQVSGGFGQMERDRCRSVVGIDPLDRAVQLRMRRGAAAVEIMRASDVGRRQRRGSVRPFLRPLRVAAQLEHQRPRIGPLPSRGQIAFRDAAMGVAIVAGGQHHQLAVDQRQHRRFGTEAGPAQIEGRERVRARRAERDRSAHDRAFIPPRRPRQLRPVVPLAPNVRVDRLEPCPRVFQRRDLQCRRFGCSGSGAVVGLLRLLRCSCPCCSCRSPARRGLLLVALTRGIGLFVRIATVVESLRRAATDQRDPRNADARLPPPDARTPVATARSRAQSAFVWPPPGTPLCAPVKATVTQRQR